MKKYAVLIAVVAIVVLASAAAGATNIAAGYVSREGGVNLTLGGRYDLGRGSSAEGSYTILPHGFDVAARYNLALYKSSFVAGPVFEGMLMGDHVSTAPAVGAGVFAEKPSDGGIGLHGRLTFRQRLDCSQNGVVAAIGATIPLANPLVLGVDASMGLTGGVAGTDLAFTVGYSF